MSRLPRAFLVFRPRFAVAAVTAALAVAGGLSGPAAAADPPEAVAANEAGIDALLDGEAESAIAKFEAALERAPGHAILERNLAAALARLAEQRRGERRFSEAIDLLDRAVRLHAARLRYRVLLGRARFEEGAGANRERAREDFLAVLERDADHLDALVNLGQIEYVERRLDRAVALWRRARDLRPDDADVRARLAKAEREEKVERAFHELAAPRFKLRHAPAIPRARAEAVLRICEEAYDELSKRYQSYPARVAVTLYTPSQFRVATRLHGWVTGLSDGTIRLTIQERTSNDALRATIYHELAHHLIRDRTHRAPVWLHEGLAQIAERKSVPAAEARLRRGDPPEAAELTADILRERDPRRVSRFYDVALGFTQHLVDRQGDPGIYVLLERLGNGETVGQALSSVYGADLAALFAEWRDRKLR